MHYRTQRSTPTTAAEHDGEVAEAAAFVVN
jgi:hypothetical protein